MQAGTARDQRLDEMAHRGRADEKGLLATALIEQPIGEDVTAVEVGGELDLVDRDEGEIEIRPLFEMGDFGDAATPEIREREARLRAQVRSVFATS